MIQKIFVLAENKDEFYSWIADHPVFNKSRVVYLSSPDQLSDTFNPHIVRTYNWRMNPNRLELMAAIRAVQGLEFKFSRNRIVN